MPTNQNKQNQDRHQKHDMPQNDRDAMRKTSDRDHDKDRSGKQAPKKDDDR